MGGRYAAPLTEEALQKMKEDGVTRAVAFSQVSLMLHARLLGEGEGESVRWAKLGSRTTWHGFVGLLACMNACTHAHASVCMPAHTLALLTALAHALTQLPPFYYPRSCCTYFHPLPHSRYWPHTVSTVVVYNVRCARERRGSPTKPLRVLTRVCLGQYISLHTPRPKKQGARTRHVARRSGAAASLQQRL